MFQVGDRLADARLPQLGWAAEVFSWEDQSTPMADMALALSAPGAGVLELRWKEDGWEVTGVRAGRHYFVLLVDRDGEALRLLFDSPEKVMEAVLRHAGLEARILVPGESGEVVLDLVDGKATVSGNASAALTAIAEGVCGQRRRPGGRRPFDGGNE